MIPYAVERNPEKFGRYTPGSFIPIISEKRSRALNPDFFLVMPWHFKKKLFQEKIFLKKGGKLIFPLPNIHMVGKNKMSKYKNYLIVGGAGQDAHFLTELLLKKKSKIYLLINNKAPKIKKNKNIISIKKINILSSEQVKNYLNKFKHQLTIFFLASYNISTTEKETSKVLKKNILINVNGLINFLSTFRIIIKK